MTRLPARHGNFREVLPVQRRSRRREAARREKETNIHVPTQGGRGVKERRSLLILSEALRALGHYEKRHRRVDQALTLRLRILRDHEEARRGGVAFFRGQEPLRHHGPQLERRVTVTRPAGDIPQEG